MNGRPLTDAHRAKVVTCMKGHDSYVVLLSSVEMLVGLITQMAGEELADLFGTSAIGWMWKEGLVKKNQTAEVDKQVKEAVVRLSDDLDALLQGILVGDCWNLAVGTIVFILREIWRMLEDNQEEREKGSLRVGAQAAESRKR